MSSRTEKSGSFVCCVYCLHEITADTPWVQVSHEPVFRHTIHVDCLNAFARLNDSLDLWRV